MAFSISTRAFFASRQSTVKPQLVLKFEGYDRLFGVSKISKAIRIGDPGLYINNLNGQPWVIGGLTLIDDQGPYISFNSGSGSSARITQALQIDKGSGNGVPKLAVTLVDKDEEISELISPGFELDEILGRSAEVLLGFEGTSFPEDFITIFRGINTDIISGPGNVTFELTAPEQLKRQTVFPRRTGKLDGTIAGSGAVGTITLESTADFPVRQLGPDGTYDSAIQFFVKIDDEIFSYTGISGNNLTGCVRAELGSSMAAHSDATDVESFVRITENGVLMALKLMLSGWNGPYKTGAEIQSFGVPTGGSPVANAISFKSLDIDRDYGLTVGDWISVSGATEGANNFATLRQITEVVVTESGIPYIVVDGAPLVEETNSSAVASLRSKYDTLGYGLKMRPTEVDVEEHEKLYEQFLSSFTLQHDIKEAIEGKAFIDLLYVQMTCYSIPRKARASIGYTIGPIPGTNIVLLNLDNVTNADQLKPRRSIAENFYNGVLYTYDKSPLDDAFKSTFEDSDTASLSGANIGLRSFEIEAPGIRSSLSGAVLVQSSSQRILNRYQRGAEYIKGIEIHFGQGFTMEIGDIVAVDYSALKMTDVTTGNRNGTTKLMEIINKTIDFRSGKVTIDVLNTAYLTSDRFALISPSSLVRNGIDQKTFNIKRSFSEEFGDNEFLKWADLLGVKVIVRNDDWSVFGQSTLERVSGNKITLASNLGFVPSADHVFEFDVYDNQPSFIKALFGFMTDDATFPDDTTQYQMI